MRYSENFQGLFSCQTQDLLRIRAFTLSFMGAETISQTLINPSQRELRMSEIVIQTQLKLTYVKKELCGAEL